MPTAEEVYEYVKEKGTVLPINVAEHFNIQTLFASAFLSELVSKNKIKVSFLKVGSSPIYYVEEKKELLEQYIDNLHEKEQKTLMLLKSKKILEDIKLELLDRVALRKMKDFAVPLNVTIGYENRLYWKYYTITDEEAENIIKKMLLNTIEKETEEKEEKEKAIEEIKEIEKTEYGEQKEKNMLEKKQEETILNENKKEKRILEKLEEKHLKQKIETKPIKEKTEYKTKEKTTIEKDEKIKTEYEEQKEQKIIKETKTTNKKKEKTKENLKQYTIKLQEEDKSKTILSKDSFGKKLLEFFEEKNIQILYVEIPKKETEVYGVIIIPSVIGELEYFFYAKNKKSINEKDIKEAFVESTILGYPLLFLAKGKISKNAYSFSNSKLKSCTIIEL